MGHISGISVGRIIVFLLLGLILGGILGECFGWLFSYLGAAAGSGSDDNVVKNFFIKSWELKLGYSSDGEPLLIDLHMIRFNFAVAFKFNIISIIGVFVAAYIMKWSGK